jgi:hypothetical protein
MSKRQAKSKINVVGTKAPISVSANTTVEIKKPAWQQHFSVFSRAQTKMLISAAALMGSRCAQEFAIEAMETIKQPVSDEEFAAGLIRLLEAHGNARPKVDENDTEDKDEDTDDIIESVQNAGVERRNRRDLPDGLPRDLQREHEARLQQPVFKQLYADKAHIDKLQKAREQATNAAYADYDQSLRDAYKG